MTTLRKRLLQGLVIPAHPLALTAERKLDERRQRALTRYYCAAGAGGIENALTDTIYSLGIMICFYYGLTAFSCVWYFRNELFSSFQNFVFKLLFPLVGGLGLFGVLGVTLHDAASPEYGSGASIFGVGLVLILGVGLILTGLILMFVWRAAQPAFFRGETLRKDTPVLVMDD